MSMEKLDSDMGSLWDETMTRANRLHEKYPDLEDEDFLHWLGVWFGKAVVDSYKEWLEED